MILAPHWYGITDKAMPARISFFTVGIWWILFAQIPFKHLPNNPGNQRGTPGRWIFNGFKELKIVFSELQQQPYLAKFLAAFFIYTMGLRTVMYVATIFGASELKLPSDTLIITVLLIQLVGIAGLFLFCLPSFSNRKCICADDRCYNLDRNLCGGILYPNCRRILYSGVCGRNGNGRITITFQINIFQAFTHRNEGYCVLFQLL